MLESDFNRQIAGSPLRSRTVIELPPKNGHRAASAACPFRAAMTRLSNSVPSGIERPAGLQF